MHQKTIKVQLREGPHFVLFIHALTVYTTTLCRLPPPQSIDIASKMAAGQEVLFEVSVRDSAGHNQIIQVTATTTVSDIKRQFSQKTGLAQQSYQLVFAGRSLNDSDTLQVLNEPHPHTF